jgi:putative nucleotidyltransferase with HDIG domain
MGKNRETLQSLSLSHRLFTQLRAQRNLADVKRRVSRLETRFYDVVTRWAHNIESKDAYTLGHCERVADYSCALARDIGFDEMTMFWFRIGALLHDVGKIVVPSEILNKPGPLSTEERRVMERHAAAGSDLLGDIEFPWDILPLVRGHHERWDGRGYPDRLAGDDIALSARIVCIADVFDALTTDRPYRRAFTLDEALTMMTKDVGAMFDPEIFPRFERVIRTMKAIIPAPGRPSRWRASCVPATSWIVFSRDLQLAHARGQLEKRDFANGFPEQRLADRRRHGNVALLEPTRHEHQKIGFTFSALLILHDDLSSRGRRGRLEFASDRSMRACSGAGEAGPGGPEPSCRSRAALYSLFSRKSPARPPSGFRWGRVTLSRIAASRLLLRVLPSTLQSCLELPTIKLERPPEGPGASLLKVCACSRPGKCRSHLDASGGAI